MIALDFNRITLLRCNIRANFGLLQSTPRLAMSSNRETTTRMRFDKYFLLRLKNENKLLLTYRKK